MRVIDADALIDSMRKMGADKKIDVALVIHQIHNQPTVVTAAADTETENMQELKADNPSDIEKIDRQIDRILEVSSYRARDDALPELSQALVRLMDAKQRIGNKKRYQKKYNSKKDSR